MHLSNTHSCVLLAPNEKPDMRLGNEYRGHQ